MRTFNPADAVLLVNLDARAQLGPSFACSYRVLWKVGEVYHLISTSDRRPKTWLCREVELGRAGLSWVGLGWVGSYII